MPDADGRVIANAKRQAELEARHRDLTKPMPPPGADGDSLRAIPGMGGITDEMLAERAGFNLRDHMAAPRTYLPYRQTSLPAIDLTDMTVEELLGLAEAAMQQAATKQEQEKPEHAEART